MIGVQVGAYRIIERIGEGGMGSVWLAEHAMLGRRAALKVLHPSYSMRADIVTRFFNEARAATAISDPGIVQVFDFGHHVDGSAYIVMELLHGETLERRIQTRGRLAVDDALRILRQVTSSLAAAHARGIVHRDLKPDNVFLVVDPEVPGGERPKLLDFGIAKLSGDASVKTQTSAVMGTPSYMSPEQCRGSGAVDARSDIYALGCVLFAALTGRPPFDAEGVGDIIAMHLREAPSGPSTLAPGIPPAVDALVLRCLQKDPAARFASAGELAAALDKLRGASGTGRDWGIRASTTTTLSGASGVRVAAPRRGRTGIVGGIAGAALVLGIVIFVLARPRAPADAPPPDAAALAQPIDAPPAPEDTVRGTMRGVLVAFLAWARDHAGAPCPDLAALGVAGVDPWQQPLVLTCTDQPANQIVGVVSAGPDRRLGTGDDLASWELDRELVALVRGARWAPASPPIAETKPPPRPSRPARPTKPPPAPEAAPPVTAPPKPAVEYDANGMPIRR